MPLWVQLGGLGLGPKRGVPDKKHTLGALSGMCNDAQTLITTKNCEKMIGVGGMCVEPAGSRQRGQSNWAREGLPAPFRRGCGA